MVALARARGDFHFTEQGVHFGHAQHAARANRSVAGHGRSDEVEPFLDGSDVEVPVITLDGDLESMLAQAMRVAGDARHPIEPMLANRIVEAVVQSARPLLGQARNFAIVTSPVARRALARLFKPHLPETPVLSFLEIPDGKGVEVVAVVGGEQRPAPRHDPLPNRERVA